MESNKHPRQLLMRRNSDRTDNVCTLFKSDRKLTIRELSEVEIFISLCHEIVSADQSVRRVVVKLVPQVLIAEQKEKCLFIATDLLQCTESESGFLGHITTGKETQIYGYDPETMAPSLVWKSPSSPQPKKAQQVRSKTSVLLTVPPPPPPQNQGVVHHEFTSAGQTASKEYYLQFMQCICDKVCHKQPEKQLSGHGQIHQDNTPAHSSQLVQHFLAKHDNLQL